MFFRKLSASEENEFRSWARDNYKPFSDINGVWHPVVQQECQKMNKEAAIFMEDKNVEKEEEKGGNS